MRCIVKSTYCIGCKYNQPDDCSHPDADECENSSLWTPDWFDPQLLQLDYSILRGENYEDLRND